MYGAWLLFFVSARTNKSHHHHRSPDATSTITTASGGERQASACRACKYLQHTVQEACGQQIPSPCRVCAPHHTRCRPLRSGGRAIGLKDTDTLCVRNIRDLSHKPCVSLFYVIDTGSTGSRDRDGLGICLSTLHLSSLSL